MLAQDQSHDLIRQNIEDPMNVEVTTASKKEQKLSETAAAIYVITQEDIRRIGRHLHRGGARMVPEWKLTSSCIACSGRHSRIRTIWRRLSAPARASFPRRMRG